MQPRRTGSGLLLHRRIGLESDRRRQREASIVRRSPVCELPNFYRNFLWRKYEIDAAAIDCALRHVWLNGRIELLGDRDATNILDAAKGCGSISIVARNDDRNELTRPVLGQGTQKDGDNIGPPVRLRNRLQAKLAIEDVEVPACRNDEHVIWTNVQPICDQTNGHARVAWENHMQHCRHGSKMIHDNNRDTHVGRQVF